MSNCHVYFSTHHMTYRSDCLPCLLSFFPHALFYFIPYSNGTRLYVTYSLNGKEHKTSGVKASTKPCWQYEKCVRLDVPSIQQSKVTTDIRLLILFFCRLNFIL